MLHYDRGVTDKKMAVLVVVVAAAAAAMVQKALGWFFIWGVGGVLSLASAALPKVVCAMYPCPRGLLYRNTTRHAHPNIPPHAHFQP